AEAAPAEPVAADEPVAEAPPPDVFAPEPPSLPSEGATALQLGPGQRCRALIESVWIRDAAGKARDFFDSGEEIEIGFSVLVGDPIHVLQAGVRIKTVEGVEAYGTSTAYVDASLTDVPAQSRCVARVRLTLSLGAGTYFVSVAVAETLSVAEMAYLDKRSDVLMFHVRQHPLTGTGIADLLGQFSFGILEGCREIAHGAAEAEAGP
ncbi:MAG: Wzt carbohydrate-binding domain-containing protein, partial [Phycisphaerae bacterium]